MAEKPTYTILNPCHIALSQSTICEYEYIKTFAETTLKTLKNGDSAVLLMPSVMYTLTEQEQNCKMKEYSEILQNEKYFKNSVIVGVHEKTPKQLEK